MSDAISLVNQAVTQSTQEVMVQAQVSLLKQAVDLQKDTMKQLLEMFGLGQNVDLQA